jgi:hypothetical protein
MSAWFAVVLVACYSFPQLNQPTQSPTEVAQIEQDQSANKERNPTNSQQDARVPAAVTIRTSNEDQEKAKQRELREEHQASMNDVYVIANIGVAILTGLLALFAFLTFRTSKDTAKRQLRAYIGIKLDALHVFNGRLLTKSIVSAILDNYGQTPALKCVAAIRTNICGPPILIVTKDFQWAPYTSDEFSTNFTVFPRAASASTPSVTISMDELIEIYTEKIAFVLYVSCMYRDIFGKRHTTTMAAALRLSIDPRELLQQNSHVFTNWHILGRYDHCD